MARTAIDRDTSYNMLLAVIVFITLITSAVPLINNTHTPQDTVGIAIYTKFILQIYQR